MRAGSATARAVAIAALVGIGLGAVGAPAVEVITTYRYDAAGNLILIADGAGDASACGGAAVSCATGTSCCAGQCISVATSSGHCGACGSACSSNHIAPACAGGSCDAGTCSPGWADCDGDKRGTGCEADILSSAATCGGCTGCSSSHVTPACSSGSCAAGTCAAGWGDCNKEKRWDGC